MANRVSCKAARASWVWACALWCFGVTSLVHAAEPPPPPGRAAVEAALVLRQSVAEKEGPLRLVLLDDRKDHGPAGNGLHDYPLWKERWALLLGGRAASAATHSNLHGAPIKDGDSAKGTEDVTIEQARGWPSDAQFASANVIVAYCYLAWTDARKKQVADYLGRGGGLVLIHSATWTKPKADPDVAALVGIGGFQRFRHGEVRVELAAAKHAICRGLPRTLTLKDETYWPPTPPLDASRVTVLATSREKVGGKNGRNQPQPLFWTYKVGRGRVFGCVPGHFAWTFDDPWFRLWLLRGMAWAAGGSPYRFDDLALRGARVSTEE